MPIEDIVNVEITVATATVSQQGFGVPLVLAYHNAFPERTRTYSSSTWQDELVSDGITSATPAYQAIRAIMSQSPKPRRVKLGRLSAPETQLVNITAQAGAAGQSHSFTIEAGDGTTWPILYLADPTPTAAEVVAGLMAAVNATTAPVTASVSGTTLVLTADAPNTSFGYHTLSSSLKLTDETALTAEMEGSTSSNAVTASLNAIWAEDKDWYGLALATGSPAAIQAASLWVESHPIIFAAQTHDSRTLDGAVSNDVMSTVHNASRARTIVTYHSHGNEFIGAALLAARMTGEPGDATWKFTNLRSITPDKLTTAQEVALIAKRGNYYTTIAARNVLIEGWAADGSFLDLTQLSDWTVARIKEGVFALLASNRKLPFSDTGGRQLYGAIWNSIAPAMDGRRFLKYDGDPETHRVVVPPYTEVPEQDRARRQWSGIEFSFSAANAVHSVGTIRGTITI